MANLFLSYVREDKEIAARVQDAAIREGHQVFRDESGIAPGRLFAAELDRGLRAADVMVVVVSKDAPRSPWVRFEVISFLVLTMDAAGGPWIIPLQLDATEAGEIFALLRSFQSVDCRRDFGAGLERLLAALRSGGRGDGAGGRGGGRGGGAGSDQVGEADRSGGPSSTSPAPRAMGVARRNSRLLTQVRALLKQIVERAAEEEILYGRVSPETSAEVARLEFEMEGLLKEP